MAAPAAGFPQPAKSIQCRNTGWNPDPISPLECTSRAFTHQGGGTNPDWRDGEPVDWRFADCGRRFRPCVHTVSIALLAVNRTFQVGPPREGNAPPLSRYARPYPHPRAFVPVLSWMRILMVLGVSHQTLLSLHRHPCIVKKNRPLLVLDRLLFSLAAIVGLT